MWLRVSRIVLLVLVLVVGLVLSKIDIDFDPYKELGVAKHATQKEIKKAYKKLALRYHPDRTKDDSSTEKMSRINEAIAVIGDEKKRKEYDQDIHNSRRGHNIFRRTHQPRRDDGLGILLTQDNSYNLLRTLSDRKPWLIFVYEGYARGHSHTQKAREIFEDACSKLSGLAHCGKFDANRQRALVNEFRIQRVPTFVAYYNDLAANEQHTVKREWGRNGDLSTNKLVDTLSEVLPTTCTIIHDMKQLNAFFDTKSFFSPDLKHVKMDNDEGNKVKALIFSDSHMRKKPHVMLQYLANKFSKSMDFGYHFVDTSSHRREAISKEIAESLGMDLDDLEPPEMYVFRSPMILSNLIKLMAKASDSPATGEKNEQNEKNVKKEKTYTLEDMGIYRISLDSDVASMTQFVLQYFRPLTPKLDGGNFADFCYLGTDGRVDDSKVCFVFGVVDESQAFLEEMLTFGQYLLANMEDSIPQFGWINCVEQASFCKDVGLNPLDADMFSLSALWMTHDRFLKFTSGEKEFKVGRKNGKKVYEKNELVKQTSMWIAQLEEASNNKNLKDKSVKWKRNENVGFPIKPRSWSGGMSSILSPILSIVGFGASAVGTGASAIGTLISYVFQFGFIFVLMFVILPMLRSLN